MGHCRCVAVSGDEDDKCKFFQRSYRSICPAEWVRLHLKCSPSYPYLFHFNSCCADCPQGWTQYYSPMSRMYEDWWYPGMKLCALGLQVEKWNEQRDEGNWPGKY